MSGGVSGHGAGRMSNPAVSTSKTSPQPSRLDLPLGSQEKILALRGGVIHLGEPDADGKRALPDRILFLKAGDNDTTKGRVIVNATTAAVLQHNQDITGHDHVAFDFQHNTVGAEPKDEPVSVAGHGRVELVAGEGLWLSDIQYTDAGAKSLSGGHYPDVSGAVKVNESGEVIWVHSVGAVRNGAAPDMELFAPKPGSKTASALAKLSAEGHLTALAAVDGDSNADESGEVDFRRLTIHLLNALGAELELDSATDAEIAQAAESLKDGSQKPSHSDSLKTKPTSEMSDSAATTTLTAESLNERLTALEAGAETDRRAALVKEASRAGKVIPLTAEQIAETPLITLQAMVENLKPNQINVEGEEVMLQGADTSQASAGGITPTDRAIMTMLGVDEADFRKANGLPELKTSA